MTTRPYTPRPGGLTERVITALQAAGQPVSIKQLAADFGLPRNQFEPSLRAAIDHGVVIKIRDVGGICGIGLAGALPPALTLRQELAQASRPRASQPVPQPPLLITHWPDGDITCIGATYNDDGTVFLTPAMQRQLVDYLTRPVMPVGG